MAASEDTKMELRISSLDMVLLCLGGYLLLYRLFIRSRRRQIVQILAQFSCGASLVFFAPLLTWLWVEARVPVMLLFGGLFGTCLSVNAPLSATITIGAYAASLTWQLGLCGGFIEELGVPFVHGLTCTLFTFAIVLVFCGTPLGPMLFERGIVPVLGATLLSTGLAELVPSAGALSAGQLLDAECAPTSAALINVEGFLAIASIGVLLQTALLRVNPVEEEKAKEEKNAMAKSLLPQAEGDEEDGGLQKWRPGSNNEEAETNSRFQMLVSAIYAPDGTSQEHLTEEDKKIVDVCRKDPFERDRITWGGGLI